MAEELSSAGCFMSKFTLMTSCLSLACLLSFLLACLLACFLSLFLSIFFFLFIFVLYALDVVFRNVFNQKIVKRFQGISID